ncbi:MAG: 50S ribosomal protein L15 [Acidimicrobiia bacterium]|nr:50S ribosomal protein L15 [Acidimicrobiia bacterium]
MGQLKLHHLKPADGSKKTKIRVGRGEAGRRGKTAGRGTKGTKARNTVRPGFEGGRVPLQRRLPHLRGFKNPNKEVFTVVNVEALGAFKAGATVTPASLRSAGLVKKKGRVKVLGTGEIDRSLTVEVHAVSSSAKEKIEAAGGTVRILD